MIIKEAILKSLQDLRKLSTSAEVCQQIIDHAYYDFNESENPAEIITACLTAFIKNGDYRVKRIKNKQGCFYYLTELEDDIELGAIHEKETAVTNKTDQTADYHVTSLHTLLSSYLNGQNSFSKTILDDLPSVNDKHQHWIHPDMVSVDFLTLKNNVSQTFLKVINQIDTFKMTSYKIVKEINTDYELKESFFQAVSNSSWANYGYLVAFEISSNLYEEIHRLNQSFDIGVIELDANPYASRILYSSGYKDLDFKTIDKLCKMNKDFEGFIEHVEKLLAAEERYVKGCKNELEIFCDDVLINDSEITQFCIDKHIPLEKD